MRCAGLHRRGASGAAECYAPSVCPLFTRKQLSMSAAPPHDSTADAPCLYLAFELGWTASHGGAEPGGPAGRDSQGAAAL